VSRLRWPAGKPYYGTAPSPLISQHQSSFPRLPGRSQDRRRKNTAFTAVSASYCSSSSVDSLPRVRVDLRVRSVSAGRRTRNVRVEQSTNSRRESMVSLSAYPDVSLKLARDRREDARKLIASGVTVANTCSHPCAPRSGDVFARSQAPTPVGCEANAAAFDLPPAAGLFDPIIVHLL
jgi:hypothetical protein